MGASMRQSGEHMTDTPYDKIKSLLRQQEKFPFDYLHKFIGKNSPEFQAAVEALERDVPKLKLQSRRESGGGKHVAYTYTLNVQDAEEVAFLFELTQRLVDILIIL